MYLKVGTDYTFPLGTADIGITREVLYTENDQPHATRDRWALDIMLVGSGAADIDAKVAALNTAFNSNGKDFRLTMPNGTTDSQHVLLNAGSISGTKIIQRPSVTTFAQAGGVTNLRMTAVIEAEYPTTGSSSLLRMFEESLTFEGGGPQYGYLLPLYGRPQKQTLRRSDSYRATQSGSAVGMYARPFPPDPIFAWAQLKAPRTTKKSPRRRGNGYEDYFISWVYEFEDEHPLQSNPNVWL